MADRFIFSPFRFGALKSQGTGIHNGIAVTDDADRHLKDKIMAVLFTGPGERVNAPRFGVGLNRTVFEAMDELMIAAVEFRLAEGLRRDIGDELVVTNVDVTSAPEEGQLLISIDFYRRTDRQPRNLEVVV
jgi:phage baseplate assembly protein W